MYITVVAVALAGLLTPAALDRPAWQTDYSAARKLGREGHRPLAVFIGSGQAGWNAVSRDGKLSSEARRILAANYVCVYVDTTRKVGENLASAFDVPDGTGLVISDASGRFQAFHHSGELDDGVLIERLQRYADPQHVVISTESDGSEQVSYYQPTDYVPQPSYRPAPVFYPSFARMGGGC